MLFKPRERVTGRGATVRVDRVSKSYGTVRAVQEVSLEVAAGEFVSLLGPSGSGKTTLLMMIAGFEVADSGSILIGGADMTRTEPNRRNVGMVFQRYALFPHLSVGENIAFSLRMRKLARERIREKVEAALAMVRLSGYAGRSPDQLSGGQQQRVALARATVFDPPVILMDEPLGALDKKLREHMQIEIKQLQRELGATVIYVTHDQQEALTMSDRVAVMNHGRIEQVSPPQELYDRPASIFVADFVGDTNRLAGTLVAVSGGVAVLALAGGAAVRGTLAAPAGGEPAPGDRVVLCIRPERIAIGESSGPRLGVRVDDVIYSGPDQTLVAATPDGQSLRIRIAGRERAFGGGADGTVDVAWAAEDALVFPDDAGRP